MNTTATIELYHTTEKFIAGLDTQLRNNLSEAMDKAAEELGIPCFIMEKLDEHYNGKISE